MIRLYKPLRMLVSMLAGTLAGALFRRIWKIATREDEAPKPTDAQRGWGEILLAAALQGVIFALVKAAADRGMAEGARKLTGVWPGESGRRNGKRRYDGRIRRLTGVPDSDRHQRTGRDGLCVACSRTSDSLFCVATSLTWP